MDQTLKLLLGPAGVTVLTLIIVFSGWKRIWVWGWYAKRLEEELAEWKAIAMRSTHVTERVVEIAEKSPDGPA